MSLLGDKMTAMTRAALLSQVCCEAQTRVPVKYFVKVNTRHIIYTGLYWWWRQISNKREAIGGRLQGTAQLNKGGFIKRMKMVKEKEAAKNNIYLSPRAY